MGKDGDKKKAAPSRSGVCPLSAKDMFWDTLNEADRKLAKANGCGSLEELEEARKKQQDRENKAWDSQQRQIRLNEEKRQREKQEEARQRDMNRQAARQRESLERVKKRAFTEGVVEAEEGNDGQWYAKIDATTWKEVQGQFFCKLCEKHLNESNLEVHLMSDAHNRKVAWGAAALGPSRSEPAQGGTAAWPSAGGDVRGADPDGAASAGSGAGADVIVPAARAGGACPCPSLPSWQQLFPDGLVRCVPCGKVVDDNHLTTADHTRRLAHFLQQQDMKMNGGGPAPAQEHLAYAPTDPANPHSERLLKCLLCQKWVGDDWSHAGTSTEPSGSKDHQKNLRNYVGTPWYQENVIALRRKYHPLNRVPPTPAAAPTARPAPLAPWAGYTPITDQPLPSRWGRNSANTAMPLPPPRYEEVIEGEIEEC